MLISSEHQEIVGLSVCACVSEWMCVRERERERGRESDWEIEKKDILRDDTIVFCCQHDVQGDGML